MFILQVFKALDIDGKCNKIHVNNILTFSLYLTKRALHPHEKYQPVDTLLY